MDTSEMQCISAGGVIGEVNLKQEQLFDDKINLILRPNSSPTGTPAGL